MGISESEKLRIEAVLERGNKIAPVYSSGKTTHLLDIGDTVIYYGDKKVVIAQLTDLHSGEAVYLLSGVGEPVTGIERLGFNK